MHQLLVHHTARILGIAVMTTFLLADTTLADDPIPGNYQTSYGPLKILVEDDETIVGIYEYKRRPAQLRGQIDEKGFYSGLWVQATSEVRCSRRVLGSPFWGRFRFTFKDGKFLGLWNYCDRALQNHRDHRWTGRLVEASGRGTPDERRPNDSVTSGSEKR